MADLTKALNEILSNWGHNILLQRKNPSGNGWQDKLERHTVRHTYPSVRGLPQVMQERPEGLVHTVDIIYYFRPEARPREGDRIYEEDSRYEGHAGGHGSQTTWLIDYALAMRGRGGRIEFWTAGVTREEPN